MKISNVNYPWMSESYQHLYHAYENNKLPHALLFSGQKGIGKLHLAQKFAKTILCDANISEPCNQCQNCHLLDLGHHADFKLVQPEESASMIKIDQIRSVCEFAQHTAQRGQYKIIIIDLAEQLNIAGTNALLKSLEEPQGKTLFILITEKVSSLLPTLLSRCQKVNFKTPNGDMAKSWLLTHNAENKKLESKRLELALYLAENAPLAAQAILLAEQDVVFKKFTQDLVKYLCGKISLIDFSEAWHKSELNLVVGFMQLLIVYLIKQVNIAHNNQVNTALFELPESIKQQIFNNYSYQKLSKIYQKTIETKKALIKKIALNNQMAIEGMLLG